MSSADSRPSPTLTQRVRLKLLDIKASRGWSIGQMAEECGIPKSSLDGYLKDVAPSLDALEKIARRTGHSVGGLLGEWEVRFDGDFELVERAAFDELLRFFEEATTWTPGRSLQVKDGRVGGERPEKLARDLAQEIAIRAAGLRQYAQEVSASTAGSEAEK